MVAKFFTDVRNGKCGDTIQFWKDREIGEPNMEIHKPAGSTKYRVVSIDNVNTHYADLRNWCKEFKIKLEAL